MGLAIGAARILLCESLRRPLEGSVLTLGRQFVTFTESELRAAAAEFGVRLATVPQTTLHVLPELARKRYLSNDSLFALLGFSDHQSTDFSDYEHAHIIFDLNRTDLPESLKRGYDFIIDCGTMEHIFHVPNFLANLHAMLRPGGRILHLSPASNYVEHEFYSFSPTFFTDYYGVNQYEISRMQMVKHTPLHDVPWEVSDYWPGCLDPVSYGGLDDGMYVTLCIVTKTPNSTSGIVPQQGGYRRLWEQSVAPGPTEAAAVSAPIRTAARTGTTIRIKDFIKRHPLVYRPIKMVRDVVAPRPVYTPPKKGLGLEVVARY